MIDVYSKLTGRIILVHPTVDCGPVSLQAVWTNQILEKEDVSGVFKKYFNERGASAISDGKRFLQLVPSNMSQATALTSEDLPVRSPKVGAMLLSGDLGNLVEAYARLSGRRRSGARPVVNGFIPYLNVTQSLSEPEVFYILETFLHWNGFSIVLGDDNTFSIMLAGQ